MSGGDPFVPRRYRVGKARRELPDITTLDLVPVAGAVPPFEPGQFNMLYAFGIGEAAISVSGDPADRERLVHTIRDVGAVSSAIAKLRPGMMLGVRGPFGIGWPVEAGEGSDVVIVAGGLGLAPLRPAIYRILARRERYGKVAVLYGTRSPADILYRHELERWRQRFDVDISVIVDRADPLWRGQVGVVTKLVAQTHFDPHSAMALVCGPELMMRFTAIALRGAGMADEHIHLSMERNMKCAIGLCGHCQFGPSFICKDGPVMRYDRIADLLAVREV